MDRCRAAFGAAGWLLLLAAGCSEGSSAHPCSGVDCSSRGFCVADQVDAYCSCLRGYHPVFQSCEPNDTADECLGVDCSGHGTCRPTPDGPTCDCAPGYRHLEADDICRDTECDLLCVPGNPSDAGAEDAEAGDGGCPTGETSCSAVCVVLATDPAHCGACGAACAPAHANGACVAGVCEVSACEPGWVDANGVAADGCEYACTLDGPEGRDDDDSCTNGIDDDCDGATDAADGGCGSCVPETCDRSDDDCDGLTDEDFDIDFDAANCGACGRACPAVPHGTPACVLGHCAAECDAGFADLDGNAANGCEAACTAVETPDESRCDGVDDDCNGLTDDLWAMGGMCGEGFCRRDAICVGGEVRCEPRDAPADRDTTCDGIDDDCDGLADEDWVPGGECLGACATAAGCIDGAVLCGDPAANDAICDGIDDDCDGAADEDWTPAPCGVGACERLSTCTAGVEDCAPGAPVDELCNGADDDCDGAAGCADPDCDGRSCDDGNTCTHTDTCGALACAGTTISCPSDACATRSCNGTSSCTATYHSGAACTADSSSCTRDVCNATGGCTHPALADGTSCGTTWQKCCGGACVNISTDEGHCAGCGLTCYTGYSCTIYSGWPTCDCGAANIQCHGGSGQLCSTTYGVCACTSSSGCATGQTCVTRSGPNYCTY
jgi:hypothetical protein